MCLISAVKYLASRSSLMSFSVTEEAIYLPCEPDLDMAGVVGGEGKGLELWRWSSGTEGLRKEKGVG